MKIVGIDEVGRGPIAGPVTVCVVACDENLYDKLKRDKRLPPKGFDSKKLSPLERQNYNTLLMSRTLLDIGFQYAVAHVSNKMIDRNGISFCIKKAIKKGIDKLKLTPLKCKVLLDGSLKAPEEFKNQKTIIKGDQKEKIIAWASILAKVSRDRLMCSMAKKFPKYGLEFHKGYGTKKHRQCIKKYGPSAFHRKTFCRHLTLS